MSTQSITLVDLVSDPQWVAWRSEMRDGKLTKLPYFTAQRLAESDNPSTWLPHDQAAAVAKVIVNGTGGGVGIELGQCQKTWIIGIDLDTCRDPDTGSKALWRQTVRDKQADWR
jgi:putative DNA primase/helicase